MVSLDIAGHGGRNKFPHLGWHLTSSNPSHTQQQQQQRKYNLLQILKTYVDRESTYNISAGRKNGSTVRKIPAMKQICSLNTLNHSPLE
jgi:hypothetical protein